MEQHCGRTIRQIVMILFLLQFQSASAQGTLDLDCRHISKCRGQSANVEVTAKLQSEPESVALVVSHGSPPQIIMTIDLPTGNLTNRRKRQVHTTFTTAFPLPSHRNLVVVKEVNKRQVSVKKLTKHQEKGKRRTKRREKAKKRPKREYTYTYTIPIPEDTDDDESININCTSVIDIDGGTQNCGKTDVTVTTRECSDGDSKEQKCMSPTATTKTTTFKTTTSTTTTTTPHRVEGTQPTTTARQTDGPTDGRQPPGTNTLGPNQGGTNTLGPNQSSSTSEQREGSSTPGQKQTSTSPGQTEGPGFFDDDKNLTYILAGSGVGVGVLLGCLVLCCCKRRCCCNSEPTPAADQPTATATPIQKSPDDVTTGHLMVLTPDKKSYYKVPSNHVAPGYLLVPSFDVTGFRLLPETDVPPGKRVVPQRDPPGYIIVPAPPGTGNLLAPKDYSAANLARERAASLGSDGSNGTDVDAPASVASSAVDASDAESVDSSGSDDSKGSKDSKDSKAASVKSDGSDIVKTVAEASASPKPVAKVSSPPATSTPSSPPSTEV